MLRKIKNLFLSKAKDWFGIVSLVWIIVMCFLSSTLSAQDQQSKWSEFIGIDDLYIFEIPHLDDDPYFDNEFNDYLNQLNSGLSYIKDLGIKWIRVAFEWDKFEPEKGKIAIGRLRKIIQKCRKEKLDLVVVFSRKICDNVTKGR